jgi:methyl-accepting chemotaxis protein
MKLSIKTKLIAAFALLILLTVIIFYIGSNASNDINNSLNRIVNINASRVVYSTYTRGTVHILAGKVRDMCLLKEPEQIQESVKDFENKTNDCRTLLVQLSEVADERGLELISEFEGKYNEFLKHAARIQKLVIKNSDSTRTLATAVLFENALPPYRESIDIMTKIVEKNRAELKKASDDTNALYAATQVNSFIILAIGFAFAIAISYWIIRSISLSINEAKTAIKSISEGDLTVNVSTDSKDEIGEILLFLHNMTVKLKEVMTTVVTSADNIASASLQMSSTSQEMSQGSQEQAASAEEISSSMEEMASNIQQNTDNAQQTEKIAIKAADEMKEGSTAVNQTVESMKKIADKIGIIGEIARQTNLLALNAAVEAARAGEHGKGFAVVAAEVRKLAERSQVAAAEINDLSTTSVAIADRSGRLLTQIVPNIQNTAKLVQEIAASNIEQSNGAEQINNSIQQFNKVIQQNAAGAEEIASSSEELASQADHLRETISFFKIDKHQRIQTFSFNGNGRSKNGHANQKIKNAAPVKHANGTGVLIDLQKHDELDKEYQKF